MCFAAAFLAAFGGVNGLDECKFFANPTSCSACVEQKSSIIGRFFTKKHCVWCHGETGEGDMEPNPRCLSSKVMCYGEKTLQCSVSRPSSPSPKKGRKRGRQDFQTDLTAFHGRPMAKKNLQGACREGCKWGYKHCMDGKHSYVCTHKCDAVPGLEDDAKNACQFGCHQNVLFRKEKDRCSKRGMGQPGLGVEDCELKCHDTYTTRDEVLNGKGRVIRSHRTIPKLKQCKDGCEKITFLSRDSILNPERTNCRAMCGSMAYTCQYGCRTAKRLRQKGKPTYESRIKCLAKCTRKYAGGDDE